MSTITRSTATKPSPRKPPGKTKLPESVTIREYRDADAPAVLSLLCELQSHELPFNRHLKPVSELGHWYVERLVGDCSKHAGVILIAEIATGIAGVAVLLTALAVAGEEEERAHHYALVSELIVSAAARGRGIGQRLLAECERRAKGSGRDELRLAVEAGNRGAYEFYRRNGYRDAKIRMRKEL